MFYPLLIRVRAFLVKYPTFLLAIGIPTTLQFAAIASAVVTGSAPRNPPQNLQAENQKGDAVIGTDYPILTWTLGDDGAQTSYEVMVASNPSFDAGSLIFDSRWISSSTMVHRFAPKNAAVTPSVHPGKKFYWKVRVGESGGAQSEWSTAGSFNFNAAIAKAQRCPPSAVDPKNYHPIAPYFTALPIMSIQPTGWLLSQMKNDVSKGLAGHMDELSVFFRDNTYDTHLPIQQKQSYLGSRKVGSPWWSGETQGNWLNGLARLAWLTGDPAARAKAERQVKLALDGGDAATGYLGMYDPAERFQSPAQFANADLWTQTCLMRALWSYANVTDNQDIRQRVARAVDYTMQNYNPDRPYFQDGVGRGGVAHALVFADLLELLYDQTGDRKYVAYAQWLFESYVSRIGIREDDIFPDHLAQSDRPLFGHAATVAEFLRVPLFLWYATGEERYRRISEEFFAKIPNSSVPSGALLGDEDVNGRKGEPASYYEYCTIEEMTDSFGSLLRKTGELSAAEKLESLFYNSAQAGRLANDGGVTYLTRDDRLEAKGPGDGYGARTKFSPTQDDVAPCCPANSVRVSSLFLQNTAFKHGEDELDYAMYAPSTVNFDIRGQPVKIALETNYPFAGKMTFSVQSDKPATFNLRLRKPAWCQDWTSDLPFAEKDGWLALRQEWKPGQTFTVHFTMRPEIKTARDGTRYVQYGPLIFGLPVSPVLTSLRSYPLAGFADYRLEPVHPSEAQAGYMIPAGLDAGKITAVDVSTGKPLEPWSASPVELKVPLVDVSGKTSVASFVPVGSSPLRITAFPQQE